MGIVILIPQLKTLRLRELKQLTQAHTAGKGRAGIEGCSSYLLVHN